MIAGIGSGFLAWDMNSSLICGTTYPEPPKSVLVPALPVKSKVFHKYLLIQILEVHFILRQKSANLIL